MINNMEICKICKKELPKDSFELIKRKYRSHICRGCRSQKEAVRTRRKRKIKFSRAWFNRRFCRLKQHARNRNIKFELNFEDFCRIRTYKNEKCFYCGTTRGPFSIERLDNAKGYNVSNCVVACWRCNKMKSKDFTMEEMKILGKALRKIDKTRKV